MRDRRVSFDLLRSGKGSADHQGDKSDDGFLVGGGVGGGTGGGVSVERSVCWLSLSLLLFFIVMRVYQIYRIKKIREKKLGVKIHVKKQMSSFYIMRLLCCESCASWRNCKVAGVISDPQNPLQSLSLCSQSSNTCSPVGQPLIRKKIPPTTLSTPPTFAPLSSLGDFSFLSYPSSLMLVSKFTLCVRIRGHMLIHCVISFSSSPYALSIEGILYVYAHTSPFI